MATCQYGSLESQPQHKPRVAFKQVIKDTYPAQEWADGQRPLPALHLDNSIENHRRLNVARLVYDTKETTQSAEEQRRHKHREHWKPRREKSGGTHTKSNVNGCKCRRPRSIEISDVIIQMQQEKRISRSPKESNRRVPDEHYPGSYDHAHRDANDVIFHTDVFDSTTTAVCANPSSEHLSREQVNKSEEKHEELRYHMSTEDDKGNTDFNGQVAHKENEDLNDKVAHKDNEDLNDKGTHKENEDLNDTGTHKENEDLNDKGTHKENEDLNDRVAHKVKEGHKVKLARKKREDQKDKVAHEGNEDSKGKEEKKRDKGAAHTEFAEKRRKERNHSSKVPPDVHHETESNFSQGLGEVVEITIDLHPESYKHSVESKKYQQLCTQVVDTDGLQGSKAKHSKKNDSDSKGKGDTNQDKNTCAAERHALEEFFKSSEKIKQQVHSTESLNLFKDRDDTVEKSVGQYGHQPLPSERRPTQKNERPREVSSRALKKATADNKLIVSHAPSSQRCQCEPQNTPLSKAKSDESLVTEQRPSRKHKRNSHRKGRKDDGLSEINRCIRDLRVDMIKLSTGMDKPPKVKELRHSDRVTKPPQAADCKSFFHHFIERYATPEHDTWPMIRDEYVSREHTDRKSTDREHTDMKYTEREKNRHGPSTSRTSHQHASLQDQKPSCPIEFQQEITTSASEETQGPCEDKKSTVDRSSKILLQKALDQPVGSGDAVVVVKSESREPSPPRCTLSTHGESIDCLSTPSDTLTLEEWKTRDSKARSKKNLNISDGLRKHLYARILEEPIPNHEKQKNRLASNDEPIVADKGECRSAICRSMKSFLRIMEKETNKDRATHETSTSKADETLFNYLRKLAESETEQRETTFSDADKEDKPDARTYEEATTSPSRNESSEPSPDGSGKKGSADDDRGMEHDKKTSGHEEISEGRDPDQGSEVESHRSTDETTPDNSSETIFTAMNKLVFKRSTVPPNHRMYVRDHKEQFARQIQKIEQPRVDVQQQNVHEHAEENPRPKVVRTPNKKVQTEHKRSAGRQRRPVDNPKATNRAQTAPPPPSGNKGKKYTVEELTRPGVKVVYIGKRKTPEPIPEEIPEVPIREISPQRASMFRRLMTGVKKLITPRGGSQEMATNENESMGDLTPQPKLELELKIDVSAIQEQVVDTEKDVEVKSVAIETDIESKQSSFRAEKITDSRPRDDVVQPMRLISSPAAQRMLKELWRQSACDSNELPIDDTTSDKSLLLPESNVDFSLSEISNKTKCDKKSRQGVLTEESKSHIYVLNITINHFVNGETVSRHYQVAINDTEPEGKSDLGEDEDEDAGEDLDEDDDDNESKETTSRGCTKSFCCPQDDTPMLHSSPFMKKTEFHGLPQNCALDLTAMSCNTALTPRALHKTVYHCEHTQDVGSAETTESIDPDSSSRIPECNQRMETEIQRSYAADIGSSHAWESNPATKRFPTKVLQTSFEASEACESDSLEKVQSKYDQPDTGKVLEGGEVPSISYKRRSFLLFKRKPYMDCVPTDLTGLECPLSTDNSDQEAGKMKPSLDSTGEASMAERVHKTTNAGTPPFHCRKDGSKDEPREHTKDNGTSRSEHQLDTIGNESEQSIFLSAQSDVVKGRIETTQLASDSISAESLIIDACPSDDSVVYYEDSKTSENTIVAGEYISRLRTRRTQGNRGQHRRKEKATKEEAEIFTAYEYGANKPRRIQRLGRVPMYVSTCSCQHPDLDSRYNAYTDVVFPTQTQPKRVNVYPQSPDQTLKQRRSYLKANGLPPRGPIAADRKADIKVTYGYPNAKAKDPFSHKGTEGNSPYSIMPDGSNNLETEVLGLLGQSNNIVNVLMPRSVANQKKTKPRNIIGFDRQSSVMITVERQSKKKAKPQETDDTSNIDSAKSNRSIAPKPCESDQCKKGHCPNKLENDCENGLKSEHKHNVKSSSTTSGGRVRVVKSHEYLESFHSSHSKTVQSPERTLHQATAPSRSKSHKSLCDAPSRHTSGNPAHFGESTQSKDGVAKDISSKPTERDYKHSMSPSRLRLHSAQAPRSPPGIVNYQRLQAGMSTPHSIHADKMVPKECDNHRKAQAMSQKQSEKTIRNSRHDVSQHVDRSKPKNTEPVRSVCSNDEVVCQDRSTRFDHFIDTSTGSEFHHDQKSDKKSEGKHGGSTSKKRPKVLSHLETSIRVLDKHTKRDDDQIRMKDERRWSSTNTPELSISTSEKQDGTLEGLKSPLPTMPSELLSKNSRKRRESTKQRLTEDLKSDQKKENTETTPPRNRERPSSSVDKPSSPKKNLAHQLSPKIQRRENLKEQSAEEEQGRKIERKDRHRSKLEPSRSDKPHTCAEKRTSHTQTLNGDNSLAKEVTRHAKHDVVHDHRTGTWRVNKGSPDSVRHRKSSGKRESHCTKRNRRSKRSDRSHDRNTSSESDRKESENCPGSARHRKSSGKRESHCTKRNRRSKRSDRSHDRNTSSESDRKESENSVTKRQLSPGTVNVMDLCEELDRLDDAFGDAFYPHKSSWEWGKKNPPISETISVDPSDPRMRMALSVGTSSDKNSGEGATGEHPVCFVCPPDDDSEHYVFDEGDQDENGPMDDVDFNDILNDESTDITGGMDMVPNQQHLDKKVNKELQAEHLHRKLSKKDPGRLYKDIDDDSLFRKELYVTNETDGRVPPSFDTSPSLIRKRIVKPPEKLSPRSARRTADTKSKSTRGKTSNGTVDQMNEEFVVEPTDPHFCSNVIIPGMHCHEPGILEYATFLGGSFHKGDIEISYEDLKNCELAMVKRTPDNQMKRKSKAFPSQTQLVNCFTDFSNQGFPCDYESMLDQTKSPNSPAPAERASQLVPGDHPTSASNQELRLSYDFPQQQKFLASGNCPEYSLVGLKAVERQAASIALEVQKERSPSFLSSFTETLPCASYISCRHKKANPKDIDKMLNIEHRDQDERFCELKTSDKTCYLDSRKKKKSPTTEVCVPNMSTVLDMKTHEISRHSVPTPEIHKDIAASDVASVNAPYSQPAVEDTLSTEKNLSKLKADVEKKYVEDAIERYTQARIWNSLETFIQQKRPCYVENCAATNFGVVDPSSVGILAEDEIANRVEKKERFMEAADMCKKHPTASHSHPSIEGQFRMNTELPRETAMATVGLTSGINVSVASYDNTKSALEESDTESSFSSTSSTEVTRSQDLLQSWTDASKTARESETSVYDSDEDEEDEDDDEEEEEDAEEEEEVEEEEESNDFDDINEDSDESSSSSSSSSCSSSSSDSDQSST